MNQSLLQALSEAVVSYPDNVAARSSDDSISYSELWHTVCRVAGFLKQQRIQAGDKVALITDNSIEYIVIYYGILAAGGVVVSLNGTAKDRSLIAWLEHSRSVFLFIHKKYASQAILEKTRQDLKCVLLTEKGGHENYSNINSWDQVQNSTVVEPEFDTLNTSALASIIYTSGTTGSPKGVMLSHQNLIRNIESIISYLEIRDTDSIVNILPFYYSYGNSILHTHLLSGACLILENSLMYPHRVVELMQNEKVSGFSGVPSTYSLLLNRVDLHRYDLRSLRYMTQAGGPMAPSEVDKICKVLPDVRFFVMYGQTEASARLSYLPPEKLDKKPGSIGIPIPGVRLEVRNKQGRQAEVDETGEIYASGDNIMMGYWQDEEMTGRVLRNGWLKTGDLAKYDKDGYIYIIGRSSDMIKSGSHRISPKEIEEVILELEEVREVAVLGVKDEILGEVIKACIVLCENCEIDERHIKAHCHKNLPPFKLPKYMEFIDDLPKTDSGKVKRYLL